MLVPDNPKTAVIKPCRYEPLVHRTYQEMDVRLTARTVELFLGGKRIAAHLRSYQPGLATTLDEHRPKAHQKHSQWTPGRMIEWGKSIGPECARLVEKILQDRPHPEMGFRACLDGSVLRHDRAIYDVLYKNLRSGKRRPGGRLRFHCKSAARCPTACLP